MRLAVALVAAACAAACASSRAVPRPFPGAPEAPPLPTAAPPEAPGPAGGSAARYAQVVHTALSLRGVPYRNGGSDPKGFDCSGFVQYVYAQHGVPLPRETREQLAYGRDIRLAAIAPGDLIFFATTASREASHVGVAIGGDEFIHAPSSRGVVRVEKFSAPYWARRIVGIRRLP